MERENVKVRTITAEVKGKKIEFEEHYLIDPITGEEKFDRELEIENDTRLYDIYKKQTGLLTTTEIKEIRKKYCMSQKEYALSIGVGEITVHRFENGAIQTEAADAIMRLSIDPDNMYNLLIKNQNNLPKDRFLNFMKTINELQKLKKHNIAKYNINNFIDLKLETIDANTVAKALIKSYNSRMDNLSKKYEINDCCVAEYITPLKLQKLLYYIQGLSLQIYGIPAFYNKIYAWSYGPVVEDVYKNYKGRTAIKTKNNDVNISSGLNEIINLAIESYGQIEAEKLITLTHEEEPWLQTEKNCEIEQEKIRDYFIKVYNN